MSRKKWEVASCDKDAASALSAKFNIDPFAALLLVSRGLTGENEVESFLSQETELADPFEIKDMDKAAERINRAIDCGEKIAVYGDYDADGVTATALLYMYLELLGADVTAYIPDRSAEGYGLNNGAIDRLNDAGVKLIVTVDNGVSALNEAEYISQLGMELVVTDHHKVGDRLPRACAVVDPHRPDCPSRFKHLAGVGVALKLAVALSDGDEREVLESYADLAAIGTIADVVSLTGENRTIVRLGLEKINRADNVGVGAVKEICTSSGKSISSVGAAFSVVPRINAVGRVGSASDAFSLLVCDNAEDASELAKKVDSANAERQSLEQAIMSEVEKQIEENPLCVYDRVLIFDGEGWHGGVIGIVAARLTEKYGRPCIVITRDGDEAKGSARSIEGFSIFEAIYCCRELLTRFGGHTLAAGFSLHSRDIEKFRKGVEEHAKTVEMPFMKLKLDCRLRPEFISADILPVIDSLEPFGEGNPQPLFGLFSMTLTQITPIGGGKHLRLAFTRNGTGITALKFGVTADSFPYQPGDVLDLAVRLEKNEYMGQTSASVYIKDIRLSGTDDEKYLKSVRLFEKIKRGDRLVQKEAAFALPDRAFVSNVFRFIRDSGGWSFDYDVLCRRLGVDVSAACRVLVSIEALTELGIFAAVSGRIVPADFGGKAKLDSAPVLQRLSAISKQNSD